jgi:hypothetical protein
MGQGNFQHGAVFFLILAAMKRILLLVVSVFTLTIAFARTVPGYIILLNNDTLKLQIKVPGGFFANSNFEKLQQIETTDSSAVVKVYDSTNMKEYGYAEKEAIVKYRLKPRQKGGMYFLKVISEGPVTTLYEYDITAGNYGQEFYTFEKKDSSYLFLKNEDKLETFREKLSAFYRVNQNPSINSFIMEKFSSRWKIQQDILATVEAVNKSL